MSQPTWKLGERWPARLVATAAEERVSSTARKKDRRPSARAATSCREEFERRNSHHHSLDQRATHPCRAATRLKSEKPRSSREGKRSKRLKRQQQEREEKYRKRQCRANHEQQHQLSKLRATHDVQHQHSGAINLSRWGLPHAPNPTPRKGATAIVLRIRLARYCGISSKNNSAIAPILFRLALHCRSRRVLRLDPGIDSSTPDAS